MVEDYYRLLDIDDRQDSEAIAAYLLGLNREYRKRSNHRDAEVREEALAKLNQINEASALLGPDADRDAYDRDLAGFRAEQELKQPLSDIDLYQMFGLEMEAEADAIESTLQRAEADSSKANDDEAQLRYQKLIALARRTLLDPEKRRDYDVALGDRRAYAEKRDEAKPMPLRLNGATVHGWADLEPVLGGRPELALALLQDGEIEGWLRWSLNQRRHADWVRNLARRSQESATPYMELEELLRYSNENRPLHVYPQGKRTGEGGAVKVTDLSDLPRLADQHRQLFVAQFPYILEWALLSGVQGLSEKYMKHSISEDNNIQLERLLFCIDPTMAAPGLRLGELENGAIDFGVVQAWSKPTSAFTINHFGRGYLYGQITVSKPWLRVVPGLFAGSNTTVEVGLDASQIGKGQDQTEFINIEPLDGRVKTVQIQVHLHQRNVLQSVKSLFNRG